MLETTFPSTLIVPIILSVGKLSLLLLIFAVILFYLSSKSIYPVISALILPIAKFLIIS